MISVYNSGEGGSYPTPSSLPNYTLTRTHPAAPLAMDIQPTSFHHPTYQTPAPYEWRQTPPSRLDGWEPRSSWCCAQSAHDRSAATSPLNLDYDRSSRFSQGQHRLVPRRAYWDCQARLEYRARTITETGARSPSLATSHRGPDYRKVPYA